MIDLVLFVLGIFMLVWPLCRRRPRARRWTIHRAGTLSAAIPIEHGWRFVQLPIICHVSPAGKHHPIACTDCTGEERYASLFRAGMN